MTEQRRYLADHGGSWMAWLDSGEWERSLDAGGPMMPAMARDYLAVYDALTGFETPETLQRDD